MEIKKIIVGVFIAHVLWYILLFIFDADITESIYKILDCIEKTVVIFSAKSLTFSSNSSADTR